MRVWKQSLLEGYLLATARLRRRQLDRLCRRGQAPVCILFYHRVADHTPNRWTITNNEFERQMRWLQKRADMVSLDEAQRRVTQGNDRLAVSITFDDGYADNCHRAVPFLVEHKIPCTYFVSLEFVQSDRPFPHDVQRQKPLAANTLEQLRQMVDSGIELGGHTRNHLDLGTIDDEETLRDEVINSSTELAAATGGDVRFFAFPFGQLANLNVRAAELARDAGFRGVLSAFGDYNFPGANAFHLRRIHGDPEFARLKNWITLDPRKLRQPHAIPPGFEVPCSTSIEVAT